MTSPREHFPPVFATNHSESQERVADEINRLLKVTRTDFKQAPAVAIATAYLNPDGFGLLADELEQAPQVRLLLGAEPDPLTSKPTRPDPPKEAIHQALGKHQQWLARERDLTGFTREADQSAQRMVRWLQAVDAQGNRRVQVRRYTTGFLHGKAFITEHPNQPAVLAGSSNFTYAGLAVNAELNLGYPSNQYTHLVQEWYDRLWDASTPYPLDELYATRWEPHSPWLIFLRMLWELYEDDPDDDLQVRTLLNLTGFQREGVARMLRILEKHNGVIVADEVGLGKTFMAGEVINRAASDHRQHVLVLSPAALKNGMWEPFLKEHDFSRRVEVMSYEEFRNRWQENVEEVRQELDQYALVVVDEAHNLRNPNAQRTEAVNALVGGAHPKRVVLLTATPVNNSLRDLRSLVSLFIRNDAALAPLGIPSIFKYIQRAEMMDPESLSHEHLFDLLDQVAVRRTRKFVKEYYQGETIRNDRGEPVTVEFPSPQLGRVSYDLDNQGLALVEAMVYALEDSEEEDQYEERKHDPNRLMMARYLPAVYRHTRDPAYGYQFANAMLLRSTLLKRLESSPVALVNTLEKVINSHQAFLDALDQGWVLVGEALREWTSSDDADLEDFLDGLDELKGSQADRVENYKVDQLRADIRADLDLLGRLLRQAQAVAQRSDPKLRQLIKRLEAIAEESRKADRYGISPDNRRKTIIFSSFSDTIYTIRERVAQIIGEAEEGSPLADFKGRIAPSVFGSRLGADTDRRARVIAQFAPDTAGGRTGQESQYDLLFTTDVLSEGVNLQQAGRIINYDLPWNPMRVVQRHGRIDRIGSPHKRVFIDCFFPADHLNALLGLEERLRRKLALADAAIGSGKVLPGMETTGGQVFSDIERLRSGDISILEERGGNAALSGEEYRRRLRQVIQEAPADVETMQALAYSSGSGLINPRISTSGFVFCAKVEGHLPWFRFVPVDHLWDPVVGEDGRPVVLQNTLTALIVADPGDENTERVLPDHVYEQAFAAWEVARADVFREWDRLTDPNSLMPDVPKAFREAKDLVDNHGDSLSVEDKEDLLKRLNTRPSSRTEKEVRDIVNSDEKPASKLSRLYQQVKDAGLQPVGPIDPLPVIDLEDIHLVVWMAVQAG